MNNIQICVNGAIEHFTNAFNLKQIQASIDGKIKNFSLYKVSGKPKDKEKVEELLSIPVSNGLIKIWDSTSAYEGGICHFISEDCSIMLTRSKNLDSHHIEVFISTANIELKNKLVNSYNELLIKEDDEVGGCYVLAVSPMTNQLTIKPIGYIQEDLRRQNYSKNVLKDYDYIRDNLNSDKPKGRLVILNGIPGTGKTTLIKGLVNEVKNCDFVFINPDLISRLADPGFINLFSDHVNPIVLVLEDADNCLSVRDGMNKSEIQSVLNLADGIVGQLLDIRIIATTNVPKIQFDKAILRKGRLCRHIEVPPLTAEHSNAIVAELTGKPGPFTEETTLADIYGVVYEMENNSEDPEENKMGF